MDVPASNIFLSWVTDPENFGVLLSAAVALIGIVVLAIVIGAGLGGIKKQLRRHHDEAQQFGRSGAASTSPPPVAPAAPVAPSAPVTPPGPPITGRRAQVPPTAAAQARLSALDDDPLNQ